MLPAVAAVLVSLFLPPNLIHCRNVGIYERIKVSCGPDSEPSAPRPLKSQGDGSTFSGRVRDIKNSSATCAATRRDAFFHGVSSFTFASLILVAGSWGRTSTPPAGATAPPGGISVDALSGLVYEDVLGSGSYKTVYLVSGRDDRVQYALAVQRLRSKRDVADALRGVRVAERLRFLIAGVREDANMFEKFEGWWVQDKGPQYEIGRMVFPFGLPKRWSQHLPGSFLGSKWLFALKPVYDMDLRKFSRKIPDLHPVGRSERMEMAVAGVKLSGNSAVQLATDLCRAGRLMHSAGVVHGDIKLKNIMLYHGRIVLIDFGFARTAEAFTDGRGGRRMCASEPGRAMGEVGYVLAGDVALYRNCREGDVYAMGKTIYEVLFRSGESEDGAMEFSGRRAVTEFAAAEENTKFRVELSGAKVGSVSRFHMSVGTRDALLEVIRSMCRENTPVSFAEAEEILERVKDDSI